MRLEGDEDGFGGGDAAAAWGVSFHQGREKRGIVSRHLHARQSFRLISAVWSFWVTPESLVVP